MKRSQFAAMQSEITILRAFFQTTWVREIGERGVDRAPALRIIGRRESLLTRIIVDARDVDPNPSRSWPPVSRQCVKVSREGCTSGDRVGIHARSPVLCAPVKVTVVDVSLPLNGNPCSFIAVSSHRTFPSNENTFDLLLSSPAIEQETV